MPSSACGSIEAATSSGVVVVTEWLSEQVVPVASISMPATVLDTRIAVSSSWSDSGSRKSVTQSSSRKPSASPLNRVYQWCWCMLIRPGTTIEPGRVDHLVEVGGFGVCAEMDQPRKSCRRRP